MSQKVNWGILSTGTIAHNFAKTMVRLGGNRQVLAVASRSLEKAQKFAQQYGISKAYGSYEEMVSDPEIDIIYVATPHTEHAKNMKLCIEHGKNILCEKPFTVNEKEAKEVYALAQEKKVFVMEAFWTKFIPIYREVERILVSGEIGEIQCVTAQYGYCVSEEKAVRKFNPQLAGGALLDIGVYTLGFVAMFLGYHPETIFSVLTKNQVGTDKMASILLKYPDGKTAQLTAAIQTYLPLWGEIFGTAGRIEVPDFKNPETIKVFVNGKDPYEVHHKFDVNGFEYEIYEAENCVKNKKKFSEVMRPEHTMAVMRMMDQIRLQNAMIFPTETPDSIEKLDF